MKDRRGLEWAQAGRLIDDGTKPFDRASAGPGTTGHPTWPTFNEQTAVEKIAGGILFGLYGKPSSEK